MPAFDAFIPAFVRTHLAQRLAQSARPCADELHAAVLFADLSGFSSLAERFAARGPRGAEDLRDLLNLFFGRLVDLVHAHRGEVFAFPGDAALALWPARDDDAPVLMQLAAACGLAAQDALRERPPVETVTLRMRIGLGFGDLCAAHVGGVADRWHLVVAGSALAQAVEALKIARPGEVIASAAVRTAIEDQAAFEAAHAGFVRLLTVTAPPVPPPEHAPCTCFDDTLLRRYVPRSVQTRIDAGQTEWLAEFRRLAVLFVNLGPLDLAEAGALDRLHRATVAVQTAVHRYGGNIDHLLADDKGTVVACGWGLALHAHTDDALRAARAALEMRRELTALGISASFGLTAGEAFTGLRGTDARCDFAMIGSVVNRAAALMQSGGGDIICDAAFCDAAGPLAHVEPLVPMRLKGHERPVEVHRLVEVSPAGGTDIVGRRRERAALDERLEALIEHGRGSIVVIEGDAGIGKSRLLASIVERAVARSVRVVLARGDAIERSAPYHVWRGLFETLLGRGGDGGDAESRLLRLLESAPGLVPFASLLNPVLGLSLPETERARGVTPRGRAALTRDLLVHLVTRAVGEQPTLFVLDDTHWFDSASWALAAGIERALPRVLLLIAMRPVPQEEAPWELQRMKARETTSVLRLEALAPHETRALVCLRLRSRTLDRAVERLILDKAEGHPFFTEELAHALRDRGLVHVVDGVCRFTGAQAAGESVALPNTARVMVSSRIDQLTVPLQLTVKVASVLGRAFDLASLAAIHPLAFDSGDLRGQVEALVEHELLRTESDAAPRTYEFKHAITQEVAYSLLPHAQRRQLHGVVARFLEQRHAADLRRYYPLLADHWGRAGVTERALFYREKAGEDAMSRFANEEAIRFFTEALEIDRGEEAASPNAAPVQLPRRLVSARDARRMQWRRRLGEACVNLGAWPEGWEHLSAALAAAGYPLPRSRWEWAKELALQAATQLWHRLRPPSRTAWPTVTADLLLDTVRAFQRICSVSYLQDRKALLFHSALTALNLAERLGPSLELATLYANAGNIAGLIPLHALARGYIDNARRIARELQNPAVDARILFRTSLYRLAMGDWSACDDLEHSMVLSDQVGDPFQWEESAALRARAAQLRAEFALAVALGERIRARSTAIGTGGHEIWGIDAEAWGRFYQGQHQLARELAETGLARPAHGDKIPPLDLLGISALVHAYEGRLTEASEAANRVAGTLSASSRVPHFAVLAMSAAAETYVVIASVERATPRGAEALARAAQACRWIRRYSRINPPAAARGWLWQGCVESLRGDPAAANAAWRRCLSEADRFALPYEAARAHYEIARTRHPTDWRRRDHLARAEAGFRALGAEYEIARVEAALAGGPDAFASLW